MVVVFVIAVCMTGVGCSAHTIDDPYLAEQSQLSGADNFAIALALSSSEGNATGTQIGDSGYRNIVLTEPYEDWLAAGLAAEFRRAGFQVEIDPVDGAGKVEMDVHIERLYGVRESGCKLVLDCTGASAIVEVELTDPRSGNRYGRRFVGYSSSQSYSMNTGDLEQDIRKALTDAYAELVAETHALLTSSMH